MKTNILESDEYLRICSKRVAKVIKFTRSSKYATSLLKCALSSIPRWRYARELDSQPREKKKARPIVEDDEVMDNDSDDEHFDYVSVSTSLRGIARAQKGLLEDCRRIMKGKDELVEYFLNRETEADVIRLEVWRSMVSSAAYLSEKNLAYASNPYRVIRGEMDSWDFAHAVVGMPGCCADSGCEEKIYRTFRHAPDEEARICAEINLVLALDVTKACVTITGGSHNGYIEGLFSICRMLGLRLNCVDV